MKLLLITGALAVLLGLATLDQGLVAWDAEDAYRRAMDRCLFAGNSPATCIATVNTTGPGAGEE